MHDLLYEFGGGQFEFSVLRFVLIVFSCLDYLHALLYRIPACLFTVKMEESCIAFIDEKIAQLLVNRSKQLFARARCSRRRATR